MESNSLFKISSRGFNGARSAILFAIRLASFLVDLIFDVFQRSIGILFIIGLGKNNSFLKYFDFEK